VHRRRAQPGRLVSGAAAAASLLLASIVLADSHDDEHDNGGKGYFAIGWSALDLGPLNDVLQANGYRRFTEDFLSLGGGGYGVLGRFVIGGQGHGYLGEGRDVALGGQNFRSEVSAGMGFVDLGWVLWSSNGWALTPLVGLGGGGLTLQIDALSAPTFGEVLAQPGHRSKLSTGGFLIDLGASFDFLLRRDDGERRSGPLFGLRAGWVLSPIEGGWELEGRDIAGGPDLGVSGPYVRILLGGGSLP
jgi:hypothetical protein